MFFLLITKKQVATYLEQFEKQLSLLSVNKMSWNLDSQIVEFRLSAHLISVIVSIYDEAIITILFV